LPLGRGHEEEIINAIKEGIYGLIGFLVGEMGSRASCKYTQGFTMREKAFWLRCLLWSREKGARWGWMEVWCRKAGSSEKGTC
jgi:hypothetical protein